MQPFFTDALFCPSLLELESVQEPGWRVDTVTRENLRAFASHKLRCHCIYCQKERKHSNWIRSRFARQDSMLLCLDFILEHFSCFFAMSTNHSDICAFGSDLNWCCKPQSQVQRQAALGSNLLQVEKINNINSFFLFTAPKLFLSLSSDLCRKEMASLLQILEIFSVNVARSRMHTMPCWQITHARATTSRCRLLQDFK